MFTHYSYKIHRPPVFIGFRATTRDSTSSRQHEARAGAGFRPDIFEVDSFRKPCGNLANRLQPYFFDTGVSKGMAK